MTADHPQPLAIITGASSGIGMATAERLAHRGYRTVLIGRRREVLEQLAGRLSAHAPAAAHPLDITERQQVLDAFGRIIQDHGPPDVLVNNAGAGLYLPFAEHSLDEHERMMRLNYFGALWCTHAALPAMLERGRGHVFNVASIAAKIGPWGHSGYAAAKAALIALTESLAAEHVGGPVRFTAVLPGIIATRFFDHPSYARMGERRLRRAVPADRVARAIVRAIDRPRLELIVPRHYRLIDLLSVLSRGLAHRLVARSSRPAPLPNGEAGLAAPQPQIVDDEQPERT